MTAFTSHQMAPNPKNKVLSSHLKAFQRMIDIFHQEAFSDIQRSDSKLRTYSLLKLKPGFENYLREIVSVKERTALTKLRLSNHMLMIEKGRHQNLDRNLRFCPFCPNVIEDEMHFLLKCTPYQHLRSEFLCKAKKCIPSLSLKSDIQSFCALMIETPYITSQFTQRASELREFLLCKHKVLD